jgi:hypothetical protein
MVTFGQWRTRCRTKGGKLDAHLVREFRRYAQQEGFGLMKAEQIRHLQQSTYGFGLSYCALSDILVNLSWYDPAYTPGEPDATYWEGQGRPDLLALRVLAR